LLTLSGALAEHPLERRTYLAAVLILLLALSEAIGRYAFGLSGTTGFLNPQTGPTALLVALVAFLWLFGLRALWDFARSAPRGLATAMRTVARTRSLRPFPALLKSQMAWLLVATGSVSIVFVIFTTLSAWPIKGLRDLVYLWLTSLVFMTFARLRERRLIRTDRLVQALVIGFFAFIPLVSLLVLDAAVVNGRYAGLLFSAPVFALTSALVLQVLVAGSSSRWWKISGAVLGFAIVGLSGTRTPFIATAILVAVWLFARFFALRPRTYLKILVPTSVAAAACAVVYFGQQFRVFQLNRFEFGSIPTRLSFYKGLIAGLGDSFYLGGYSPGSAEAKLGLLPHFDLLRFWYDYSLLGLLLWLLLLAGIVYLALRIADPERKRRRLASGAWAAWLVVMTLLASVHNVFQTPIGVV
jgi:hypothetical protein